MSIEWGNCGLFLCFEGSLGNFPIPHGFYGVFDFLVWDGLVYDVVCDFSGF
jgi:hypothetical protein